LSFKLKKKKKIFLFTKSVLKIKQAKVVLIKFFLKAKML